MLVPYPLVILFTSNPFPQNSHLSSAVLGTLLAKFHAPTVGQCAVHPLNNPTSPRIPATSSLTDQSPCFYFISRLSPHLTPDLLTLSPLFSSLEKPDFFTLNSPDPAVVLGLPLPIPDPGPPHFLYLFLLLKP